MKNSTNRGLELAINTTILTIGRVTTQCMNFFLLPLYTSLLDASDFGKFDLISTLIVLFLPLVNMQYDQGVFRFTLDCRDNSGEHKKILSTSVYYITRLFFVYILIATPFFYFYDFFSLLFIYLLLSVLFQMYISVFMQYARGIGLNKTYALVSFVSAFCTIFLNIVFLTYFNLRFLGLVISSIISQFITLLLLFYLLKLGSLISFSNIDKELNNRLRSYCLPLIPNNLAWWFLNASNRTIIAFFIGTAANGLYSVASKLSEGFINFFNIFNLSWIENISLHFNDIDRNEYLTKSINILLNLFSSMCFIAISLLPFYFDVFINAKYTESYYHIPILLIASLFRIIVGLYSGIYVAEKDSKSVALTSVYAAVINVGVCIILIGFIGLYAASLATLFAFGCMAIFRYIDVRRKYGIIIYNKNIIAILLQLFLISYSIVLNNDIFYIVLAVAIFCIAILKNSVILLYGMRLVSK